MAEARAAVVKSAAARVEEKEEEARASKVMVAVASVVAVEVTAAATMWVWRREMVAGAMPVTARVKAARARREDSGGE